MLYRIQTFDSQELALLFHAFSRNLFTRPGEGDIYSISLNDERNSCKFIFDAKYFIILVDDMREAMESGQFARSNANERWVNLLLHLANGPLVEIDSLPENATDYSKSCARFW